MDPGAAVPGFCIYDQYLSWLQKSFKNNAQLCPHPGILVVIMMKLKSQKMNRLKDKVAVVYGNGAIGGAIATAFAREGATIFLAGLTPKKLDAIAREVQAGGGTIYTAELDALDEQAVEQHMTKIIDQAGKVDISFNAIGVSSKDVQHSLLVDLPVENFSYPIVTYTESHFITAKAAARRMTKQGNGVIIMHTANLSQVNAPFGGGRGPAWAALEALCRGLSVECGEFGVRAVCLFSTAIPETPIIQNAFSELYESKAKGSGMSREQFDAFVAGSTHRKKLTTLGELTEAAVFVASDAGSAMTGTVLNLTAGMIV
jgi:NAD(P)-dependent dehydrogenase (short-subunit alcohol dehydrogenase family)